MKKMTNDYDYYHNKLRIIGIIFKVVIILIVLILSLSAVVRIYMLNGFTPQWEFAKASESHRVSGNYTYMAEGRKYTCYQFVSAGGVRETIELKVYYNVKHPMFSYVEPFRDKKINDIKTYTILFDGIFLYLLLISFIMNHCTTASDIGNRRKERIAREIEHARTN